MSSSPSNADVLIALKHAFLDLSVKDAPPTPSEHSEVCSRALRFLKTSKSGFSGKLLVEVAEAAVMIYKACLFNRILYEAVHEYKDSEDLPHCSSITVLLFNVVDHLIRKEGSWLLQLKMAALYNILHGIDSAESVVENALLFTVPVNSMDGDQHLMNPNEERIASLVLPSSSSNPSTPSLVKSLSNSSLPTTPVHTPNSSEKTSSPCQYSYPPTRISRPTAFTASHLSTVTPCSSFSDILSNSLQDVATLDPPSVTTQPPSQSGVSPTIEPPGLIRNLRHQDLLRDLHYYALGRNDYMCNGTKIPSLDSGIALNDMLFSPVISCTSSPFSSPKPPFFVPPNSPTSTSHSRDSYAQGTMPFSFASTVSVPMPVFAMENMSATSPLSSGPQNLFPDLHASPHDLQDRDIDLSSSISILDLDSKMLCDTSATGVQTGVDPGSSAFTGSFQPDICTSSWASQQLKGTMVASSSSLSSLFSSAGASLNEKIDKTVEFIPTDAFETSPSCRFFTLSRDAESRTSEDLEETICISIKDLSTGRSTDDIEMLLPPSPFSAASIPSLNRNMFAHHNFAGDLCNTALQDMSFGGESSIGIVASDSEDAVAMELIRTLDGLGSVIPDDHQLKQLLVTSTSKGSVGQRGPLALLNSLPSDRDVMDLGIGSASKGMELGAGRGQRCTNADWKDVEMDGDENEWNNGTRTGTFDGFHVAGSGDDGTEMDN